MRIMYVCSMFDDITYKTIFDRGEKPLHAANKYHRLLCKGFAMNNVEIQVQSALPVTEKNCSKRILAPRKMEEEGIAYYYAPIINMPIVKNMGIFINSLVRALKTTNDTRIIYDVLQISASLGAVFGAKLSGKKTVAIVTDLPQHLGVSKNKVKLWVNNRLMSMANGYILLTQQMNSVVNSNYKPFIVLEGHVDKNMEFMQHQIMQDNQHKIVMYAGLLHSKYGIKSLCDSFLKVANIGEELHIYGSGDYANEITTLSKKHTNIIYHGNCLNSEVVEAELVATLLVNPRPTEGEYTKYSFPSKTLEYMVSGTPTLSTKLEGIPEEYDDYLFYFDDKETDGLANAIRSILDTPVQELASRGEKARQFVLKEKNNKVQARKILEFIEKMNERL